MPNWKKLLYSGSNGSLNTLNVSTALTASGLNYPSTDGTTGQAIVTDGSGNLSFTTITSGTTTDTGSLLTTASAAGSTITFEKGDGSTFDVTVSATATSADALVTASLAGSVLTFEKGDTSTFDIILPPGGYSGSNATAHLNQTVAAETWSFAHNLDDRYPVFTVFDSNGDIIVPNRVETVDTNNANIYFTTPRTGTVTAVIASSISQISSVTYNFTNETTVAVTHSLDTRNIHVSVYDENYALVIPESVTLDTLDTVVVTFPTSKSGTVVVAKGGHILSGSAVLAETASYIASSNVDGPLGMDSITSASYALTASYGENFVISGSIDLNGYTWPTTDGTYGVEVLTTDGAGGLSFEIPTNVYETVKNVSGGPLVKGTPVHATGSATSGNVVGVIAADALDPTKMPATYVLHQNLADEEEGLGIAVGFITGVDTRGLIEGEPVYVRAGGGWTQTKPTGSALIQNLGIVTKVAENGSGVVLGAGRSNDVPNITEGYTWVGNSDQVATATPTASFFVTSGSHALSANSASYVDFNNIGSKPTLISGSAQIASDISGSFVALSSSLESRVSINEANIESLTSATGSYLLNTTDTLTGDLTVTGKITAQEFHTEFVSASIVYQSGSTKFGNTQDDNHNFTGSVNITGSVTATSFSGIFVGAISSSAQIASDISGSFTLLSSSLENRIVLNEATGSDHESRLSTLEGKTLISSSAQIATEISGAFETVSASLSSRINSLESFSSSLDATFATDADLNLVSASVDALNAATSSYALAANISGSFTSISSSIASDIADIIDGTTTVTSASYALTASYALNVPVTASYAITASYIDPTFISASAAAAGFGAGGGGGTGDGFPYAGDAVITGSLFVSGGYISGSFKGDGSQLTGIDVGSVTTVSQTFTSQTQVVVSHNFNSKDINVAVYNSSDEYIIPDTITLTDNNTVTVDFAIATSGRIVVTKGGHIITALGLTSKAGSVATSSFSATGSSYYYDVSFESSFDSSDYSVALQAHSKYSVPSTFPGHAWVDSDKTAAGFRIVVPAFDTTTDEIHWTAIAHGESDVTASHAATSTTASYALSALTASYALNAGAGAGFPYSGSAIITGSLIVSQSFIDFTQATVISGSIFSGSFVGDGTGLTGLGYGDTKKLNQTVAATTWSFSHNMNEQYPTVTVYNDSNEVIQPTKIEGVDAQTLKLYFGVPVAGTAVAVVGGVATTQEAGFNRVLTQTSTATTWSFEHNLGNKYPQVIVYDSNDDLIIPGRVEAVDQNNLNIYFDTAQAGTATATVGGTSLTASYANTLVVTDTLLSSQQNTDVDTGTETVATVSTTYYDGAFFDYVAKDGTNYRAGTVMAVWDGSSVQYNDNSTADIGDTSGVSLAVDISGTDARLRATVSSDNWNIKAFVRAL